MDDLRTLLTEKFGVIVGGQDLVKLLGYSSADAFRQAKARSRLPVEVFDIPHRKGKFAFTADIASWLVTLKGAHPKKGCDPT